MLNSALIDAIVTFKIEKLATENHLGWLLPLIDVSLTATCEGSLAILIKVKFYGVEAAYLTQTLPKYYMLTDRALFGLLTSVAWGIGCTLESPINNNLLAKLNEVHSDE